MEYPILSYLIFFPLVGVILLLLIDSEKEKLLKVVAFLVTVIEFGLSLPLFF